MKKNLKYNDNNVCLLPDSNGNVCLLPDSDKYYNNICPINNNNVTKNANINNDVNEETINIIQEHVSDNFEFLVNANDTMFTLAIGNSANNKNIRNIISKIIMIKESSYINLNQISEALGLMKIEELNIFYIHYNDNNLNTVSVFKANEGSNVIYTEIARKHFINLINLENNDFFDFNKNSLYIVKGGDYIGIKNLFAMINNCQANLGIGRSQKSHVLSPLDFRLSCYLIAMFNFNYKLVNNLNTFSIMTKDRYLSYTNKFNNSRH